MIPKILDKIATMLIVTFFILGLWEATTIAETEIPIYQNAVDAATNGNYLYLIDVFKMGWGWSQITPAFHVDTLPFYLAWYGWYSKLILPSGFLPFPGWEDFILFGIVLLLLLPLGIYLRKKRHQKGDLLGLPFWFFGLIPALLLLLYPVWSWVHLHIFFMPGAESVFGMTNEAAYQLWIAFGENTRQFSWFFFFMTLLGIYKGAKWGMKFKKY